MPFTFPYETELVTIEPGGVPLRLERLRSLDATIDGFFALYEKTGREELFEDLCPYFGVPWPAGTALAAKAAAEAGRWRECSVLELACGLALPSLVLAKAGAKRMRASDLHPDVPEFLRRNGAHNGLRVDYENLDWRADRAEADVILGADLLYDRAQPAALLSFLARSEWRELLLADPGRPYWASFVASLRSAGYEVMETSEGSVHFAHVQR